MRQWLLGAVHPRPNGRSSVSRNVRVALLVACFASLATRADAQSSTATLSVGVTVVRTCSVNTDVDARKAPGTWVTCGKSAQPRPTVVEAGKGVAATSRIAPSRTVQADCPTCPVLEVNF